MSNCCTGTTRVDTGHSRTDIFLQRTTEDRKPELTERDINTISGSVPGFAGSADAATDRAKSGVHCFKASNQELTQPLVATHRVGKLRHARPLFVELLVIRLAHPLAELDVFRSVVPLR